jgi:hypothetical protein
VAGRGCLEGADHAVQQASRRGADAAEPLDVSSGPLNVLDHASAAEHRQFMDLLAADEDDGGGLHKQWVQFPTEIIRANADYDRYFNSKLEWQGQNRRDMHMHPRTATTELPTVEQWTRMSDENVRFAMFSRRREQNAEIDRLLGQYHAQLPWEGGCADNRLVYMSEIFKQIGSYIAAKPTGDRLNAMLALGQVVLAVREAKAAAIDVGFFD